MAKSELSWNNVDVTTLPADVRKAYDAYKASYAAMKDARNAFEKLAASKVDAPKGHRVVFAYNFGKLSVALAPIDDKPAKAATGISLSALTR